MNAAYAAHVAKAINELQSATGLQVKWRPPAGRATSASVEMDVNGWSISLKAIVSQKANTELLIKLIDLNDEKSKTLVVADVIPVSLQQAFRQNKINYLDSSGNCFIDLKGLFILIDGRKPVAVPALRTKSPGLSKSGLRVLFTLLTQPDSIDLTLRELSKQTGVSVGTAQQTIEGFRQSGYIVALDNQRQELTRKTTLLGQWVDRFADRLKPGLSIGRYQLPAGLRPADWRQINLQAGSYWGGEAAADALTNDLRPAGLTIYTEESPVSLVKKYRLVPDPQGKVDVNQVFWSPIDQGISDVPIVPPLLVYADLMANAEPRAGEAARLVYLHHIQNQL